jgi:hypothetical protein
VDSSFNRKDREPFVELPVFFGLKKWKESRRRVFFIVSYYLNNKSIARRVDRGYR